MNTILGVRAFADNYIWLVPTGADTAIAVDPGDAAPVFAALSAHGIGLSAIFCTHHHPDHSGGIPALARTFPVPVYAPARETVAGTTHPVAAGARIDVNGHCYTVLDIPGHTAGHIAFYGNGRVFCGDTLFSGGCGRLLGGTAAQLYRSLMALAALPDETAVYCGHEYTVANLQFALTLEPANAALRDHFTWALNERAAGRATLPTTIERERAINPFLRTHVPEIRDRLASGLDLRSDIRAEVFARLRRRKDDFKG